MCDELSRNVPRELETILADRFAHARRQVVEIHDLFPAECRYVLEALTVIHRKDALAREHDLHRVRQQPSRNYMIAGRTR